MAITVLGMGHVGIPTALGLAELGWNVTGVDQDSAKIALLQEGRVPFYELPKRGQGDFGLTR